ncbi:MAG: hypothetical protein JKY67_06335 [Pseudomonadales bacterium]|nr:hypothetical protein [Pseudomonadales bacterium]
MESSINFVKQRWILRFRLIILLLLVTVGGLGCAGKKVIHYSIEQRYSAAQYAIKENIRLQAIADACAQGGTHLEGYGRLVQHKWWEKNWPYIAVSEKELNDNIQLRQGQKGKIAGQLDAIRFVLEAQQDGNVDLVGRIVRTNYREKACERYLDPYRSGQKDMDKNEVLFPVLEKIKADHMEEATTQPHLVPKIDSNLKGQRNKGRSLVLVEKIARQRICLENSVINIYSKWPLEYYGVYCNDGNQVVVRCDWGNCKQGEDPPL